MQKILLTILAWCCLMSFGYSLDYYWKGGDGDFNDPQKWSIGSPTGITASQAPISTDDVYFGANNLANTQPTTVTFNNNSNCHDFVIDSSIVSQGQLVFQSTPLITFDVYGSFQLSKGTAFDFQGILRFRSIQNGQETIRTHNHAFHLHYIEFDGGGNTEWLFLDSFLVDDYLQDADNWSWHIPTGAVVLTNGTINSNHQTMMMDFFYSKNNATSRGIVFNQSRIFLRGYNRGNAKTWWIDFDATSSNYSQFSAVGAHFIFTQTAGEKQYGFFGRGMEYDSISSQNILRIEGQSSFDYLYTEASTYFIDARLSVGFLLLSPTDDHYFNNNYAGQNNYLEIDSFYSSPNCSDFVTLRGFAKSYGRIRKKHSGTLQFRQVVLENMLCDTSGGRSYEIIDGVDDGGNGANWMFHSVAFTKMKFVDQGNQLWSDPNNWKVWSGTQWDMNTTNCIPTPFVDVYVDATSFPLATKKLIVDVAANCRGLFWNNNTVAGAEFEILKSAKFYGSMHLSATMGQFYAAEGIYFHGHQDTLFSNGVKMPKITFWKYSSYTIATNLQATEIHGWVYSTINAKNITIQTAALSLGNRILDSVQVLLTGVFYDFGATQVVYKGNTTFCYTATSGFVDIRTQKEYAYSNDVYLPHVYSNGITLQFNGVNVWIYGDVRLLGNAKFKANNIQLTGSMQNATGKLILHKGCTYEIKNVSIADSLIAVGDCNRIITLRPHGTSQGFINVHRANIVSCFIQGVQNQGTTIATLNSIDGGNSTGWQFNTANGMVFYWRASMLDASDYNGNWSDPNHWTNDPNSLVGNGACMPSLSDTVVFDSLSFSVFSNGCHIDQTAFCHTFLCQSDITITGNELYVAGSYFLYSNMSNYNQVGGIYFVGAGTHQIDLNGTMLRNCGVTFSNENGIWEFNNDFYLHDDAPGCYMGFILDAGLVRLNGHKLTIRARFRADRTNSYRVLDMRNSQIDLLCNDRYNNYYGYTWDISNSVGMTILSENSTLNFLNNTASLAFTKYFFMGDGLQYGRVNFLENNEYSRVYGNASYQYAYFDGTSIIDGNNYFDSLRLAGGHHWYIKSHKTQTLAPEHGRIIADGQPSLFVYIESTNAGQDAYIHKEYGTSFCLDFVKIKSIEATKGLVDPIIPSRHANLFFETGANSDNINNTATGIWSFTLPPSVNVIASHIPYQKICNGGKDSIVLDIALTGTYPYVVVIDWVNDYGENGQDTFYFMDDDDNVYTPYHSAVMLYAYTNTDYTILPFSSRCGELGFFGAASLFRVELDKGVLVDSCSAGFCELGNGAHWTHFFDVQTERPISSIMDRVMINDTLELGQTQAFTTIDSVVSIWNGLPYLQRHWKFNTEFDSTAKVRLYFSQEEVDQLSMAYFNKTGISLANDLYLLEFKDEIGVGVPDTIPYSLVMMTGLAAVPFAQTNSVLGIEFQTNDLGAYMLQLKPVSSIFPLDLLRFEAKKEGRGVLVSWLTENENSIETYVVERSRDAIDFEPIEWVLPKGNNQQGQNNYQAVDVTPYLGDNYYRLKSTEWTGVINYSSIRHVHMTSNEAVAVELFPNPTQGKITVVVKSKTAKMDLRIINSLGQIVQHQVYEDYNNQILQLDLNGVNAGWYMVAIQMEDYDLLTKKLLIQH